MTVKEAFEDFQKSRRLIGCKEKTLASYGSHLLGFVRYVGVDSLCSELEKEMVYNYVLSLNSSDRSEGTKHSYVRDLKIFLEYLRKEGLIDFDCGNIKAPKMPKKQVLIYNPEEVKTIFRKAIWSETWTTARNRAIISLMYDCGLRQNEVCSLLLRNVQFTGRIMKVYGKGSKERLVAFGETTERFIRRYMETCPYDIEDTLFVKRNGGAMTTNTVKMFMEDMKKRLPFEISSHKLRHNFATNWLIDCYEKYGRFDVDTLQIVMGHESPETTKRYLHCARQKIACSIGSSHLDKIWTEEDDVEKCS